MYYTMPNHNIPMINTYSHIIILTHISYYHTFPIMPRVGVHLAGWHPAKPNEACDCETNNKHQLILYLVYHTSTTPHNTGTTTYHTILQHTKHTNADKYYLINSTLKHIKPVSSRNTSNHRIPVSLEILKTIVHQSLSTRNTSTLYQKEGPAPGTCLSTSSLNHGSSVSAASSAASSQTFFVSMINLYFCFARLTGPQPKVQAKH